MASEAVATGLIQRIESACLPLRSFPKLGPGRDRLAPNLRVTFEGRYAIYYTHDEHDIIVVRVLHGARDVENIARDGGFAQVRSDRPAGPIGDEE